jgi:hypothetical protein
MTLDADLVAAIEGEGENLSARVSRALRADLDRQRREQALDEFLDYLAAKEGPLDTPEDKAEIERFMRLLGGPPICPR